MPDLPHLGACVYLNEIATVPGLGSFLFDSPRDIEIRDFTRAGALTNGRAEGLAERAKAVLKKHKGRIGIHGPFLGFGIDMADPDLRAVVQARLDAGLRALIGILAGRGGGHMVLHSPYTTWSWYNRGTEHDDSAGIVERTHATLAPAVQKAADHGITLVLENCEDKDPAERVALAASFASPAVRVSLDTGHAHYAHAATGGPPVDAFVRAAGASLTHVHLQDAEGFADRHWAIGRGTIAWHAVFAALRELPEMPRLMLEMARPEDIMVSARWLQDQGLAG